MIKRFFAFVLLCVCLPVLTQAQQMVMSDEPQMADTFREDGKIYVVITVIALIFLSLAGFLVYIERKLKRIEDKINGK